jgi:hypothetical protein
MVQGQWIREEMKRTQEPPLTGACWRVEGLLSAILVLCVLCVPSAPGAGNPTDSERSAIYNRSTNIFAAADFYKPSGTNQEDLHFKLAPLILQEVRTNEPGQGASDVIAPDFRNAINWALPVVYFQSDTVRIRDKTHARFTYLWFYPDRLGAPEERNLNAQGVRTTLNSSGQPAIWEILNEPDGTRLVFVAQSVEAAAQAEFGKPQRGRRYAIERSLEEASNSVVPRVFDDGPAPMGPILYLTAGTRSVTTLICRCMPTQAKSLLVTRTYELHPLEWIRQNLLRTNLAGGGQVISVFINQEAGETPEKLLRLPNNL